MLISSLRFWSTPQRCNKVINSAGREEEAPCHMCAPLSACWADKSKHQFASSFHCSNLTKSKFKKKKSQVHENRKRSNWKWGIQPELTSCSDSYLCCWECESSVMSQLHGNMQNLFCPRLRVHKCIQSMGLGVSLGEEGCRAQASKSCPRIFMCVL